MPREGWKTVNLRLTLIEKIDEAIKKNPEMKSRSQLVAYVVQQFLGLK